MCALISGFGSALFHPEAARWVNAIAGKEKGKAMSYFLLVAKPVLPSVLSSAAALIFGASKAS